MLSCSDFCLLPNDLFYLKITFKVAQKWHKSSRSLNNVTTSFPGNILVFASSITVITHCFSFCYQEYLWCHGVFNEPWIAIIIKFCVGLDKTPKQTTKLIWVINFSSCSASFVYKLHECFRNEQSSLEDYPHDGRPSSVTLSILDTVRDMDESDTVWSISKV